MTKIIDLLTIIAVFAAWIAVALALWWMIKGGKK